MFYDKGYEDGEQAFGVVPAMFDFYQIYAYAQTVAGTMSFANDTERNQYIVGWYFAYNDKRQDYDVAQSIVTVVKQLGDQSRHLRDMLH